MAPDDADSDQTAHLPDNLTWQVEQSSSDALVWKNGAWVGGDRASIALDDCGLLQGAIIVERLRTIDGAPLDVAAHLARFENGCRGLGISSWPKLDLSEIVFQCAERNASRFAGSDFSIVILATPGRLSDALATPTLLVHAAEIEWTRLAQWYASGQPLRIATHRNVPPACWSPALKTRSRLQYYLANASVAKAANASTGAVLLDLEGNLTETSLANVILVEDQQLVSPPLDCILHGISLERTMRLAAQAGWQVKYESISVERAEKADEILLCGSVGCIWPAASLGDTVFAQCCSGRAYQSLAAMWINDMGLDFVEQAMEFSVSR